MNDCYLLINRLNSLIKDFVVFFIGADLIYHEIDPMEIISKIIK